MTRRDPTSSSPESSRLHRAALTGDETSARRALRAGADVNARDSMNRTALMCAIAGDNWQQADASNASGSHCGRLGILRTLLLDAHISLVTLNAPQSAYRGVTPLGMAAWLNQADAVRILLEESSESVAVDATDVHGATPLMYAARDGRVEVVQMLLRHGAFPDLGDAHHRTAVQFALRFPQIVWLCESTLRRMRLRSSSSLPKQLLRSALPTSRILEPPALSSFGSITRITDTLIHAVTSSDVPTLHSILYPSVSSHTDSHTTPVLVNLPDSDGWSAIHHCAAAEQPSALVFNALYCAGAVPLFTAHEQWTPLHCFAQASRSPPSVHLRAQWSSALAQFVCLLLQDLRVPLAARDGDDETCIHLAAEHGSCIEVLALLLECDASKTVRDMRNSRGLTALEVCRPEFRHAFGTELESLRSPSALSTYTIRASPSAVSLSSFATDVEETEDASVLDNIDISASSEQLLANLRLTSPMEKQNPSPFHIGLMDNLLREAGDLTAVVCSHYRTMAAEARKDVSALRQNAGKVQGFVDGLAQDIGREILSKGLVPIPPRRRGDRGSEDSQNTAVDCAPQSPLTEDQALPVPFPALPEITSEPAKRTTGPMKLKAWMRRKLFAEAITAATMPPPPRSPLEVIMEDQDSDCHSVRRIVTVDVDVSAEEWSNGLLRTSYGTLQAANRDLERIRECISSAEHFIDVVERCTARTERAVDRAVKKRQAFVAESKHHSAEDDLFVRPALLSAKSSIASLSSLYSARSSCVSLAATLSEQDDDDTRLVRRLLLRKIDAGVAGAQDDLEKGVEWLRVVKAAVRGTKRRACVV
ncbi:unnamed protein product [Mycena citricolor]|uniref:Ankyrin n=1 Tax=Mycena citricolor TaxID=2018698 RepID=A0AAD2H5Q1_9AGAR|nr:unnamed protein product [Mycena citricolor]